MASKFRFPPLIMLFVFCGLMGMANMYLPHYENYFFFRLVLASFFVVVGVLFVALGAIQFKSNKTTINPYTPESSTTLVTTGIYAISRNPMYVGFAFILIGSACVFSNLVSLNLILIFVLYMNYIQIPAEEKALTSVFGENYIKYKAQAPRWL